MGLAQKIKAQDKRVEQAFRPAVKLPKTSLASAAEVQIAPPANLDRNTAVAEADLLQRPDRRPEGLLHPLEAVPFQTGMKHALHPTLVSIVVVALLGSQASAQFSAAGKPQPTPPPTPASQSQPGALPGNPKATPQQQPAPATRRDPFSPPTNSPTPPSAQTPLAAIANEYDWRFTVKAGQVVSSTITAENICHGRHHFEVVNPPLPSFMRLRGESSADVNPSTKHEFPVEFDTTGMQTGLYQGTVTVRCMTCRTERGCLQDHDVLHIYMTVEPQSADASSFVPGHVLVMMPYDSADGVSATAKKLGATYGLKVEEISQLKSLKAALILFSLPEGGDVLKKIAELAPHVLLAQPDFLYSTSVGSADKMNVSPELQYGPRLIASDKLHGSVTGKGVKIAVVDTGLDASHPALAGKIGEQADMTGKGFTPDLHATLVAGIMVSEPGKKSNGITGVAPGAEILAIKACQPLKPKAIAAQCWSLSLNKGLDFAIDRRAGVINMSLGGPAGVEDKLLKRMVDEAVNRGIPVVAAAGNDGPKAKAGFPAALPNVIAVTAVDANRQLYPQATRGQFVDLAAPGVEIISTSPGGKLSVSSGTSMATAFVSATAALLLQLQPRLSPQALRTLLERTAQDLGQPGKDPQFGHGLVDACRAVAELKHDARLCR